MNLPETAIDFSRSGVYESEALPEGFAEGFFDSYGEWREYETDPALVPALINNETNPAAETFYVNIDLGLRKECSRLDKNYNCSEHLRFDVEPETGIFIPANFTTSKQVDLLIYLHGHKSGYVSKGHDMPIHRFWNSSVLPYFAFREILNNSGRNFILVAPTLGTLSQAGTLITNDGFTDFVSKVLAAIKQYSSFYSQVQYDLELRSIVLACHSGGGSPMRNIAKLASVNAFANKIKECWGFDCTYSSSDKDWYDWANNNPDKSLYLYLIKGTSTAKNAAAIQQGKTSLSNIHIADARTGTHNYVPQTHMPERLAQPFAVPAESESIFTEDASTFCTDYGQFISEATLRQQIISTAVQEQNWWANGPNGRQMLEGDPDGKTRITSYWSIIPGAPPHTVPGTAWSAVFVSSCIKTATDALGVNPTPLQLSSAHFRYAKAAFQKRFANPPVAGFYWAYDPSDRVVQVGDIIVKERPQQNGKFLGLTFNDLGTGTGANTHGDIITEIQSNPSKALVVGGNVSNTVKQNDYFLTADGKIDTSQNHYSATRVFAVLSLQALNGCILPPLVPNRNLKDKVFA